MRGAVSPLAIQIPKLSPHPPPPPPPSHGLSAISLAEQLAQHALLQLGRRALRLAARLQEFEEKLLEIVLLLARRAIFEMVPEFPLALWGQLDVPTLGHMLDAVAAIHAGLPLMYPISTA